MKTNFIIFFYINYYFISYSQIAPYNKWDKSTLIKAFSVRKIKYLSYNEKKIVYYINLARMNGPLFVDTYVKDYVFEEGIYKKKAVKTLIEKLKNQEPLAPLIFDEKLYKEAKFHAKDMGKSGKKGHRSSDGKGWEDRIRPFLKEYKFLRECNEYGDIDALTVVMELLIDEEFADLYHRRAILKPEARYIGVSQNKHKKFGYNTSILIAGPKLNEQAEK